MCMKALQDRSVAQEGVISWLQKRNETLTNEQEQYKGALRTLNKEVTTLTEKVETTKADAIVEIKVSRPFIDASAVYYGDRFEGCLK